jgi:hypothetical protein
MSDTESTTSTRKGFTYRRHGIDHWLWELVSDDIDRRDRAVAALNRLQSQALEEAIESTDEPGAYFEPFNAAVRAAVSAPGFRTAEFVTALADLLEAAQAARMGAWRRENARTDRVTDRLMKRLGDHPTPEALESVAPRLRKVLCSFNDPKNGDARLQDRLLTQQISAGFVFAALNEELLLAPDALRRMLRSKDERHQAVHALERIGPPAAPHFADDLMADLDACREEHYFDAARALASLVRDAPSAVRAVAERLHVPQQAVVAAAAATLASLGDKAVAYAPECVGRLIALARDGARPTPRYAAIAALGHVTRGRDDAVETLLALSRDPDMWTRGGALMALGEVGRQPEVVIPRLIEAFDDYQEQDPDLTYSSRHERVTGALKAFGPAAAPAIPALLARLRPAADEGIAYDRGVVEALVAIGPAARDAALPALEALADALEYGPDELDDETDELARALKAFRALDSRDARQA